MTPTRGVGDYYPKKASHWFVDACHHIDTAPDCDGGRLFARDNRVLCISGLGESPQKLDGLSFVEKETELVGFWDFQAKWDSRVRRKGPSLSRKEGQTDHRCH